MRTVASITAFAITMVASAVSAANHSDSLDTHAFEAKVTSLDRVGFRYVMTDYHTGEPVWGPRNMGRAQLTAETVVDFVISSRHWDRGRARAIEVGDMVKIYGIQRDGSTNIDVSRLEDRGRL